jgi:hypothetical protein
MLSYTDVPTQLALVRVLLCVCSASFGLGLLRVELCLRVPCDFEVLRVVDLDEVDHHNDCNDDLSLSLRIESRALVEDSKPLFRSTEDALDDIVKLRMAQIEQLLVILRPVPYVS